MKLFNKKIKPEERSLTFDEQVMLSFFSSYYGTTNTHRITALKSLENEAVYSATRIIAEIISSFPFHFYRRDNEDNRNIDRDYFLDDVLNNPYLHYDGKTLFQVLLLHLLIKGNAYAFIKRDSQGKAIGLNPLHPDDMQISRDEYGVHYKYNNAEIPQDNIFHIVGYTFDGITGLSPVDNFKDTILEGILSTEFLNNFWKNGNFSKLIYKVPAGQKPTDETYIKMKASFKQHFLGSQNSFEPIPIQADADIKDIKGFSLKDDDVLELRKQATLRIGSIYNVPAHFFNILDNANYSNVKELNSQFYKITLLPWIDRIERAINKQLIPSYDRKNYYIKFNPSYLLRGNEAERIALYKGLFNLGALTRDEIRKKEELSSIGDDSFYLNSALMTVDAINNKDNLNE